MKVLALNLLKLLHNEIANCKIDNSKVRRTDVQLALYYANIINYEQLAR